MRRPVRTLIRWTLRGLVVLILLLALAVTALAYPHPLFSHSERFGEFTVFSSEPLPADMERVVDDARARVAAMEHARPGENVRVFLCSTQQRYSIFTSLARMGSDSMALGLSKFGNVFVNETKLRRVAAGNTAGIRHCRFEGDVAASIAHEIAHFTVVEELGFWRARGLPFWKSEGYAEVQANLAATRADPTYDLRDRVDLLLDYDFWSGAPVARQLYEWHVSVEFLMDVKGLALEEIMHEDITQAGAREAMFDWHARGSHGANSG